MTFDLTTILKVIAMAVVQGIAEFLPISSSGHLLVMGRFFELPEVFTLSILLHFGTLLSVLVYFAKDIGHVLRHSPRTVGLVIVGTIPTVIIGFAILHYAKFLEESLLATGFFFLITAILLLTLMKRYGQRTEHEIYYEEVAANLGDDDLDIPETKTMESTTFMDAIIVGISQGIAALPGLSRSGTTISVALSRHFSRDWAAEFSFFLSIPVIAGGAILEIIKLVKESESGSALAAFTQDPSMAVYAIGAIVSFVVGLLALSSLMRLLKAGRLHYFAYWLLLIGTACVIWTTTEHWDQIVDIWNNNATLRSLTSIFNAGGAE